MGDYDRAAGSYDRGMEPLERIVFRRLRRRVFAGLVGRVLELGAGTGVNLPLYGQGARVVAVDCRRQGGHSGLAANWCCLSTCRDMA